MKFYALPKVDGGVVVMQCVEGADPAVEIERWHPNTRALVTGEIHEIDPKSLPTDRTYRAAWTLDKGALVVDETKKAAIDAAPKPLSLEQRIAALEAKTALAVK
jgi:hypothetical protein